MSTSERLQILVTPEQRRRLEVLAHERGQAVTALVRQAIDETFPAGPSLHARRAAARDLLDRRATVPGPDDLDRILDPRFDPPDA